jgi:hypothetical protein
MPRTFPDDLNSYRIFMFCALMFYGTGWEIPPNVEIPPSQSFGRES